MAPAFREVGLLSISALLVLSSMACRGAVHAGLECELTALVGCFTDAVPPADKRGLPIVATLEGPLTQLACARGCATTGALRYVHVVFLLYACASVLCVMRACVFVHLCVCEGALSCSMCVCKGVRALLCACRVHVCGASVGVCVLLCVMWFCACACVLAQIVLDGSLVFSRVLVWLCKRKRVHT